MMSLEGSFGELLRNPERYRSGDNYQASNIVFPVNYNGRRCIIKKPRKLSWMISCYYRFQDHFFLGGKKCTGKEALRTEAAKLITLHGKNAPRCFAFDDRRGIIVKEYLDGEPFCAIYDHQKRRRLLSDSFQGMKTIHDRSCIIGDAHVKNIFSARDQAYWLDFDCLLDEEPLEKAQAVDYLNFVYTTFTAARDPQLAKYAAEIVAAEGSKGEVQEHLGKLLEKINAGMGLWFATRLPKDGRLNEEIKRILT